MVTTIARLSLLIDPSGLIFTIRLPAASLFRELPNSQAQEMEADQICLQLAADACYDPRAAKRGFAAMKSGDDHDGAVAAAPEFLSTHPSHDTRIGNFDKWIPQAMTSFEAAYGERCREVRQKMTLARKTAEAAQRGQ